MNWYQILVEYDEMIGTIYVAADELEAFKAKYKVLSVII